MKRTLSLLLIALCASVSAQAQPGWQLNSFAVSPANAAKVVAAMDTLWASDVMKAAKGRVLLQAQLADGLNPATHSIVSLHHSLAEREALTEKVGPSDAWAQFMATMSEVAEPVASMRGVFVMSWGDLSDSDRVWQHHFFSVSNPTAFVAAINAFRDSETNEDFPGQVHLQAIVAGAPPGVTHVISVGYASETEMERWLDPMPTNTDWQVMQARMNNSSTFMGTNLAVDAKVWGPASVKSFAP